MKRILTVAALASTFPMSAMAQTERDLESHVHGAAALNLAVTGTNVFVELSSPWNNLVGIEHQPETEAQKAAVTDAIERLNDPAQLFSFNGSDCTLVSADVDANMEMGEHEDEHHDEHKDEHKDEHDEHAHDDHEDESSHSSVMAMYEYTCSNTENLSSIDATLFSVWSGFEKLTVQVLSDSGQSLVELTSDNTEITIK